MTERRAVLLGLGGLGLAGLAGPARAVDAPADPVLARALAALEASSGGRLGAAVLDCADGALAGHRRDERFTMCSTFKLSLAAAVFQQIDAGRIAKTAMLPIGPEDPVGHSPVVRAALEKGVREMNVTMLARAAQSDSDNGAANILLRRIGGPAALTRFWRALGDHVSRLDRYEPDLNTSHDGDPRDTTTPAAMAKTLRAMLAKGVLSKTARDMLVRNAVATQTGVRRLRAGLPPGWRAGDKTGTMNGAAYADKINDVALVWHPKREAPFMVAAFFESPARGSKAARPEDEAVLAQVGRIAARWIGARLP